MRCVGILASGMSSILWSVSRCLGRVLGWSSKTVLYLSRSFCTSGGIGSSLICLASSSGNNFFGVLGDCGSNASISALSSAETSVTGIWSGTGLDLVFFFLDFEELL